jgi:hypothetical protein
VYGYDREIVPAAADYFFVNPQQCFIGSRGHHQNNKKSLAYRKAFSYKEIFSELSVVT